MPLLVPDLVEPQSKKTQTEDNKEDKSTQTTTTGDKSTGTDSAGHKKVDGRTAPGMEGMSDEAVRKFEEAMELEYQKREGGA
jgi:hypothetical protein